MGRCPMPQLPFLTARKGNPCFNNENSKRLALSASVDFRNLPRAEYLHFIFGASDSLKSLTLALGRSPEFSKGKLILISSPPILGGGAKGRGGVRLKAAWNERMKAFL